MDPSPPFHITLDPAHDVICVRVLNLHIDTQAVVDAGVLALEAALRALARPAYVLVDISGLTIAPRMYTYLVARARLPSMGMHGMVVFSSQPNRLTELLLHLGTEYFGMPYVHCPDAACAYAQIALWRAAAHAAEDDKTQEG